VPAGPLSKFRDVEVGIAGLEVVEAAAGFAEAAPREVVWSTTSFG